MQKLILALRVARAVYKMEPDNLEHYDIFSNEFRSKFPGQALTERAIRDTYDRWRLDIIKAELRTTIARDAALILVKDLKRQIAIVSVILLFFAVIFPPIYVVAEGQSIHLGFAFAFNQHVGRVDAAYLICEIIGIFSIYYLLVQFTGLGTIAKTADSKQIE